MIFFHLCAAVSYIPEKVVARSGETVTVYCVFNDRNINASTATWILNYTHLLDRSQYRPVNEWVKEKEKLFAILKDNKIYKFLPFY